MRKALLILGIGLLLVVTGCVFSHRPLPTPTQSGSLLAGKIEASINKQAWNQTRIITWHFAGAEHIWDTHRKLHSYTRGKHSVLHSLEGKGGIHLIHGKEQPNPQKRIQRAYNAWINDSFWLNPLVKFRDAGVELKTMVYEEENVLTVHYASGGNTPGDTYMWYTDENHRPKMWRMWVSVVPIGGLSSSWEGWTQLNTGAWVATKHKLGPLTLDLSPVQGAKTWSELFEKDPFALLVEKIALEDRGNTQ